MQSYARSAARMDGAGRAFLPRPGRAAAACCCSSRHGRVVAAARRPMSRPPFASTVPPSDPADPVIMLPLPPARDQSARGGIYRPRNPFSLGSWRCICMHACRLQRVVHGWPSYSCYMRAHGYRCSSIHMIIIYNGYMIGEWCLARRTQWCYSCGFCCCMRLQAACSQPQAAAQLS